MILRYQATYTGAQKCQIRPNLPGIFYLWDCSPLYITVAKPTQSQTYTEPSLQSDCASLADTSDHSKIPGTWRQHYDRYSKLQFIRATTSTPTQPPRSNNYLYSDTTSSRDYANNHVYSDHDTISPLLKQQATSIAVPGLQALPSAAKKGWERSSMWRLKPMMDW